MKQVVSTAKYTLSSSRRRKILPAVFVLLSLLLMVLQLEGPVSSVKAVLSYVFIPQIRAAHKTMEYSKEVSSTVRELLDTHRENELLKEELYQVQLEKAQAREIFEENNSNIFCDIVLYFYYNTYIYIAKMINNNLIIL